MGSGRPLPVNDNESTEQHNGEIFVVDQDSNVRDVLALLFSQDGYRVTSFADGPPFVAVARTRTPVGVILDLFLPSCSALDVLEEIDAPHYGAPVLVTSASSDIPTAVEAIKRGAHDFIEKRSDAMTFAVRVRDAIAKNLNGQHSGKSPRHEARSFPGAKLLTARERRVLPFIISGSSNQATADELGISRRTVEVHRAHILAKLNARNTAELVRKVLNRGRDYS